MVIDSNTFKEKFRKFFDLLEKASLKITPFTLSLYPILINKLTNISLDPKLEQFLISFFGSGLVTLIDDYFIKNKSNKELRNKLIEIVKEIENIANQNIKFNEEIFKLNKDILKEEIIIQLMEELNLDVNSLKDQIKEKLDDIQDELRVLTDIELPKIEKFLEKDNELYNEPKLFRKQGPLWIDFNSGYVYEHPIINEIIKKLENENLIVIKGKPASGKTTILKNIGYELSKKYWDVYYIDLKTFQKQRLLEINKLKHGLIIIDDAHLDIGLIEDIFNNKPNIKLLIGTRDIDIEKIRGPTGGGKFSEYLKDSIEIKAIDYADKIINIFEEHKKNKKISDKIKNELTKNNIWILAWQLETFDKYGNIGEESFYETIRNHITTINNGETGENILIPLSFFYSYEIPVRRDYLKKLYRGNISTDSVNKDIDQLKNLNEIKDFLSDKKDYLALHHSEVAKIFFNTFKYFIDFGSDIKNIIENKLDDYKIDKNFKYKYELYFLIDYIEKYPDEFNNWIFLIEDYLQDELIKNEKFIESIPKIFEEMTSFTYSNLHFYRKLNQLLKNNYSIKDKINSVNYTIFEKKIERWDDLLDISSFLVTLYDIGYSKINKIDIKIFKEKIEKCTFSFGISSLLDILNSIGYSRLNEIEKEIFEDKIEKSNDSIGISSILKTLYKIKYSHLNDIDLSIFEKKIRQWNKPYDITRLLEVLHEIGYSGLNKINISVFEEKIKRMSFINYITDLIEVLHKIGYPELYNLLKKFDIIFFEEKIRWWNNLYDIVRLLETLKEIGYSKFDELIGKIDIGFFENLIIEFYKILDLDEDKKKKNIKKLEQILVESNYPEIDELRERLVEKKLLFVEEN
ncbi:hypothetical protein GX420_06130 [bacterium]|nr:hypothetical protein [bacterium]